MGRYEYIIAHLAAINDTSVCLPHDPSNLINAKIEYYSWLDTEYYYALPYVCCSFTVEEVENYRSV